jgi:hypothetical protein
LVKSKIEIEACEMSQILLKNKSDITQVHLESIINTNQSEFAAFEKDSTIYFSSIKPNLKIDLVDPIYSKIYTFFKETNSSYIFFFFFSRDHVCLGFQELL